MTFEPSLFLADATGTITQRLDNVWDQDELGRPGQDRQLKRPQLEPGAGGAELR